jgi:hypothetical protein
VGGILESSGSRFWPGGRSVNMPLSRESVCRSEWESVMTGMVSLLSGFTASILYVSDTQ